MPKEIVHWLIAEQTASLLRGTPLEKDVMANPECLRFGAVFPDILYYLAGDSTFSRIGGLADVLHGNRGEDTYQFLRVLSAMTETSEKPNPLTAFWIGVASHLQADIVFHPLIYYLTGNYHDERPDKRSLAIQRHRRLETVLDMYFIRGKTAGELREYTLRRICNRLELPVQYLSKIISQYLAALSDAPPEEIAVGFRRALNLFVLMQELNRRPPLGNILFRIEKVLPQPFREITALFQAPQLAFHFDFLSKPVGYRNPVSGTIMESTVDRLFTQAVQCSAEFCKTLLPTVQSRNVSVFPEWGPSLAFGIPGVDAEDARHFAPLSF